MNFVKDKIYIDTRSKTLLIFTNSIEEFDIYFFIGVDDNHTYSYFEDEVKYLKEY